MNSLPVPENLSINIDAINDANLDKYSISLSMLRLDSIHPLVSGNKIFKLHYFLDEALNTAHKRIITFGGAYSNHLAATAYSCGVKGINSIGIVRGERPPTLSHTLLFCLENGMELEFISRSSYQLINTTKFRDHLTKKYDSHTLIPEGGYSIEGANGAKLIANYCNLDKFTHICCAVGTATTFAGLINGCRHDTGLTGFIVLKNMNDLETRLAALKADPGKKYSYNGDYHFGGYAKSSAELFSFMNSFYMNTKIPLDFVYTGKMMFGVYDLLDKNYFTPGENILCVHTGGLQGNESLPSGTLNF